MQTHQGWGRFQGWGAGAQDIIGHDSWKDPYGIGGQLRNAIAFASPPAAYCPQAAPIRMAMEDVC